MCIKCNQVISDKTKFENGNLERDGFWSWNDKLWQQGNYKDGKKHGLWEYYYYGNGLLSILVARENYKDGKLDGLWERYYDNGQLRKKGSWKNEERIGLWEWYSENGQLDKKVNYILKRGKT
tara:strand:+ start:219 stop:584 length:366 start_codon:yes stop_codon:yes gene_type:complete